MIHRIEIVGLGPHRRFACELAPDGTTVISGPSEIGKSTVMEAILLALLGRSSGGRFRPELINDRADRAGVRLTLKTGLVIERGVSKKKKVTRALIMADKRRSISSESALMREIAFAGDDPEIARMVIVPMSWQPMVAANARPFRDALARILPPADTAAVVRGMMGERSKTISDEEAAWGEKEASAARREARRTLAEAAGSLAALTAQRDRLSQPAPPTPGDPLPFPVAQQREKDAAAALKQATEAFRAARRDRDAAAAALAGFDLSAPDRCPTCHRDGWSAGAEQAAATQTALADADAALAAATEAGTAAREAHNLARQLLADSQRAAGAAEQRQADLHQLNQAIKAATATVETHELEAGRLDALLDVIRLAPSRIASEQAQALGDLGPVSLTFAEKPAVSVSIDGRPWWLASRGRQVVADIHLRAAIRRAAGLEGLPIVVDNVQDVGGQPIPRIKGSAIVLRTTDETAISIRRLAAPADGAGDTTGQDD